MKERGLRKLVSDEAEAEDAAAEDDAEELAEVVAREIVDLLAAVAELEDVAGVELRAISVLISSARPCHARGALGCARMARR